MKQLKSFLSIMVVSFVVYAAPAFAADSKDVQVINTPDVNVVNMPDVRVVNTPDVNVLTMPDIRVANTPDVNVVNMPHVVVNVPTRTPIQQTVNTATTWNTNTVHLTHASLGAETGDRAYLGFCIHGTQRRIEFLHGEHSREQ